ncbi:hypothetical protein MJO28_002057 [Puccinia striiformis f. sp. tritici]|uniref:Uncharacterized protein n=2 Tax=Puccinia striiformis f. sp. tritici TaxID=168172 RepID=A0ACC0EW86_9BASI|nr:uncharacterized protein Pst134EA_031516 [Puccinia striiformis f. sp. tritici]KAH9445244.1 hypothetical protein Pst134EA_031516 [Puccinia striiformis f. sp. tritici]KAH9464318.1 hypothetical protein Pst134EB_003846 [Puccinia striiformis f. sp. tritici]KAI7961531.1 hypothetical protein MJO28_002020 [Puccinia striiformis f. sp. tritici]KAI7961568.1 hypothetical protein MJO28_002057 [Puccinia striiformis f. sp. tritici]KAI7966351.1 hypothetical protein MJO29_002099 [Puccinia striiformis f. sp. 
MQLFLILCAFLVLLQVGAAPNPSKRSIVPHTSANSASPDPKGEDAGGQHDSQAGGRASAHPQPDDPCKGKPNCDE